MAIHWGGRGRGHTGRWSAAAIAGTPTPTPTPAPSWSVQPSISGTPTVGQTLTGSDGTISNGTVSARAWLRGASAISGATGSTYLLDVADEGQNISFRVTANGAGGSAQATSTAVGPIAAAPGLTAPDITVTSAAGDPPQVTIGLKADHHPGYFLRIQRNANGAVDVNGDYTSQTLEAANNGVLYFIGADDFADGITNAELAAVGYIDPTGTYFQQYRIENEIDQVSPWVGITGTVVVATTVLHATNGVNKSQYLDVTGRTAALNRDDIGAFCGARATQQPTSDKTQFEVTLTSIQAAHTTIIAIDDGTSVYGPASYDVPGTGGRPGICIRTHEAYTDIIASGVDVSVGAGQDGDIISVTIDKTTSSIKFYRTRGGTTTQLGTTYTPTLTSWYAAVGHVRTASATINFGQEAFTRALDSGFAIHG